MNKRVLTELRELRRKAREIEQHCDRLIETESQPQNDTEEWIEQSKSGLGPRRHCAAVRRRKEAGLPDAQIIGRRHLLSPAAYAEERALIGQLRLARCGVAPNDAEEEAAYQALVKRLEN